jgi:hypothetical protein
VYEKNQVTLAYLAGVFDADGSVTIRRQATNIRWPNSYTFSESAEVGQTESAAVEIFAALWPGEFRLRKRGTANWRPMYEWRVSCLKAAEFLSAVRPYLRVKGERADLALALRASKDRPRAEQRTIRVGVRGTRLSPEITEERLELWRRLRLLNDTRRRIE